MKTKEKIIEALEGKRTGQIWELIEKSYLEVFEGVNKKDLEMAKEEYSEFVDEVNDEKNRYVLVEHSNLSEGFYCRVYPEGMPTTNIVEFMFENYFSDGEGWGDVLMIDMIEMKCYLVIKEVKYSKKEIKIK